MGFFSWNCEYCGKSLRALAASSKSGLSIGVALLENGSIIRGKYNGYGILGGTNLQEHEPQIYHNDCWHAAGKPTEWKAGSGSAEDQGYFVDDESCCCGCGSPVDFEGDDLCDECRYEGDL